MLKKLLLPILVLALLLTGCSNGVSQEQYDALLAENEQLKQQVTQYEQPTDTQDNNTTTTNQNIDTSKPSSDSDFIYVNNGSEVQINGYNGDGGVVVIPTEIEGSVVTRIAPNAFKEADSITSIVLPDKLQYIGDSAFYGLKKLTGVLELPKTITTIEGHAFQTTELTGLVISSNCEININAFANIGSLEFIYIKEGCSPKIGTSAFSYAEELTTAIFPNSLNEIKDGTFDVCNNMVIYTTTGSYAESYANRNFINVNTSDYTNQVKKFEELYGSSDASSESSVSSTTQYNITETDASFYANVLDTINSLKQIHAHKDTIELLGAVVMNPTSNKPRTIVYISYVGLDNNNYTEYFWKDLNKPEIKAVFAEDCYKGNNGRTPIKQLDLNELRYYESCGLYVPNLSPGNAISLNK